MSPSEILRLVAELIEGTDIEQVDLQARARTLHLGARGRQIGRYLPLEPQSAVADTIDEMIGELKPTTPFIKRFPNTGEDYSCMRGATKWLRENDRAWGPLEHARPVGIRKGIACSPGGGIVKWSRLDPSDCDALDGRITWEGGPRRGTAVVILREAP